MARFHRAMRARHGAEVGDDWAPFHAWSVRERGTFWRELWHWAGIEADAVDGDDPTRPAGVHLDHMRPPRDADGPRWFPNARLNYAEMLLRHAPSDAPAIIAWTERGFANRWTHAELARDVARVARALRAMGVGVGDRVAAFMPNSGETIVAMLAAASIGATWTSCSPDFGPKGVLDRFGQVAPVVLVAADGYRYGGKVHDTLARTREIVAQLPSVRHVIVVAATTPDPDLAGLPGARRWDTLGGELQTAPVFERVPFDHPLFIMYSSGTTGLPKCMVHGHGGTLLQHCKEHLLHGDVTPASRVFYFTTCGWMMWNWLASVLATGAAIVLYDGAPLPAHEPAILWRMAAEEEVTHFGASAKYLALAEKEGLVPRAAHDLSALQVVFSTGSPLADHSYDWVQRAIGDVRLSSISGGTDLLSCFALGNPVLPVHRGELQCLGLGMAVDVWDGDGTPVIGMPGELVCTRPFPSMPVAFWNDDDGRKYRAAYFDHYPGVWRHGDWAQRTPHHGLVILGRSDATLNPGGVRIGTAEIYRQVEQVPEVVEAMVVGQDVIVDGAPDVRIVLFVRLREGATLDEALMQRIRAQVRSGASPHHVPRVIVAVPDLPRTVSGKITEIAVRDVIHGRPVTNTDALANPQALDHFRGLEALRVP
ncbi:MAG: acetoacetate--CoA ligase [Gemmatimonadaceae bacterium]|nr:acetoacetate--CoA ligase [Gemmatimonadaceae bacterium]